MTGTTAPTLALQGPSGGGHRIPQLGFGVWEVRPDQVVAAVAEALRVGYRHIDTARIYGNEEGVGQALRESGVPRDEVFVTTKVWNDDQLDVERAFDASMQRLGLDVLDLYLIHWPVPSADAYSRAWEQMLALQESGRVRAVGVCNFHVPHLERVQRDTGVLPCINQIELSPYLQQAELRAFHARNGIVTQAWSPLASGGAVLQDPVVARVAERHGVTPAQAILRWHLDIGNDVIPRSVTPSRIAENYDVFGFALDEQDLSAFAELDRGGRTGPNPDEFAADAVRLA